MKAWDISKALVMPGGVFPIRRWISVPNVSWGWNLQWEADLIVVSKNNICYEIEVKISLSDLKVDKSKIKHKYLNNRTRRDSSKISKLYYAVPTKLVEHALNPEIVDPKYGVIEIKEPKNDFDYPKCIIRREAAKLPNSRKLTPDEILKLLRLGVMRIWK